MIRYHLIWYNVAGEKEHSLLFCHCMFHGEVKSSPTEEQEMANRYHWDRLG